MKKKMNKRVKLELVGLDGNAFSLMGHFQQAARRQGWSQPEINKVLSDCMSRDYNHLLATLAKNCKSPDGNGLMGHFEDDEDEN